MGLENGRPRQHAPAITPPPPPHNPGERKLAGQIGGWQIRLFDPDDLKFKYFLPRGFLHAQLWHPEARVSVLTPSRLTGGLFEVFPVDEWKAPASAAAVHSLVAREHGVTLPSLTRIAAVIQWYVCAAERRSRGAASNGKAGAPTAPTDR